MAKVEEKTITSYKGFDQDLKCREFQYEVGKEYEMDGNIECCNSEPEVYDIYFDVGLFSPLIKKWIIDKSALTREEAIKYITPWLLDTANNKIYVDTE